MNSHHTQARCTDYSCNETRFLEAELAKILTRQRWLWTTGLAVQLFLVEKMLETSTSRSVSIIIFFTILATNLAAGVISTVFLEDRSFGFVIIPAGACILVGLTVVFSKIADLTNNSRLGIAPVGIIVTIAATWAYFMVAGTLRQSRLQAVLALCPDWKSAPERGLMKRPALIVLLREHARSGAGMCELIGIMRSHMDVEVTAFGAVLLVMDAFDIPLRVARNIEGARCMGGAAIEDEALDALMAKYVRSAVLPDS